LTERFDLPFSLTMQLHATGAAEGVIGSVLSAASAAGPRPSIARD